MERIIGMLDADVDNKMFYLTFFKCHINIFRIKKKKKKKEKKSHISIF